MNADNLPEVIRNFVWPAEKERRVMSAIKNELRAADAYRDAACLNSTWTYASEDLSPPCRGGGHHVESCPSTAARSAWIAAQDRRRAL